MEVSVLSKKSLRIKGKNAVLVVDPSEKVEANAALFLNNSETEITFKDVEIVINGPGEYEVGGVKVTGVRSEAGLTYSMSVDSVSVLVGTIGALEKLHTKLKEANILVVNCDSIADAAFLTALSSNVLIFYGDHAEEIGKAVGSENVKHLPKYASTIDKLPSEVESIILE